MVASRGWSLICKTEKDAGRFVPPPSSNVWRQFLLGRRQHAP